MLASVTEDIDTSTPSDLGQGALDMLQRFAGERISRVIKLKEA